MPAERPGFSDDEDVPHGPRPSPVLSVGEITRVVGFGGTRTTRRLLTAGGVPVLRVGRKFVVERGALEECMPHFYEELQVRVRTRSKRDW